VVSERQWRLTPGSRAGQARGFPPGTANLIHRKIDVGIVEDDERAIICKFRNAAQACVAADRIIVHRKVEPDFTGKFVSKVRKLTVGNGMDPVDVGPMISAKQRDRLYDTIRDLAAAGGELLTGGRALQRPGFFFEPTVFTKVRDEMAMAGVYIFGPVLSGLRFSDLDELVGRANATTFGLAAAVWTRDVAKAHDMARRLRAGTVWVNCYDVFDAAAPFGGFKQSGFGRELGEKGLDPYLETKTVTVSLA
jgi:acyl-CoA reductase-like NAD-dependent aldehyde dehydrogenase